MEFSSGIKLGSGTCVRRMITRKQLVRTHATVPLFINHVFLCLPLWKARKETGTVAVAGSGRSMSRYTQGNLSVTEQCRRYNSLGNHDRTQSGYVRGNRLTCATLPLLLIRL